MTRPLASSVVFLFFPTWSRLSIHIYNYLSAIEQQSNSTNEKKWTREAKKTAKTIFHVIFVRIWHVPMAWTQLFRFRFHFFSFSDSSIWSHTYVSLTIIPPPSSQSIFAPFVVRFKFGKEATAKKKKRCGKSVNANEWLWLNLNDGRMTSVV